MVYRNMLFNIIYIMRSKYILCQNTSLIAIIKHIFRNHVLVRVKLPFLNFMCVKLYETNYIFSATRIFNHYQR
jgi:hypothetical protein